MVIGLKNWGIWDIYLSQLHITLISNTFREAAEFGSVQTNKLKLLSSHKRRLALKLVILEAVIM